MTELVGRQTDLQRIQSLLDAGARILTLWGPAGVGKTRLARACARHAAGFSARWFVDLCAATDWCGVATAVSQALGVALQPLSEDGAGEQLGRALAGRGRVLLVLDNFEQVIADAAGLLARWSAIAADATLLITSREILALGDEVVHEVVPLAPEAACALFAIRARAAGRPVAPADQPLVEQIVSRLDGLPLVVELAAAQVPFLGVTGLRSRLSDLEILDSGRRDLDARQRTLRGALDWSWRLLSRGEQRALAQCSVFRGGFTLAAAEATLVGEPGAESTIAVLRALHRRSLVQSRVVEGGEVRCSLLFAVRDFAAEHLARTELAVEGPAGAAIRDRHAVYFADAAGAWAERALGPDGKDMLRRLAIERDNLLAAHAHAVTRDPALAIRIGLALEPLLLAHGPLDVLWRLVDEALRVAGTADHALRGRALRARPGGPPAGRFGERDRRLRSRARDRAPDRRATPRGERAERARVVGRGAGPLRRGGRPARGGARARGRGRRSRDRDRGPRQPGLRDVVRGQAHRRRAILPSGAAPGPGDRQRRARGAHHREHGVARLRARRSRALRRQLAGRAGARARGRRPAPRREADDEPGARCGGAGHVDEADRLFAQSLAGLRAAGDVVGEGHCLANVGWEEMRSGRGHGRAHFERALTLLDAAHIGWASGLVRATLAGIAATEDRVDEARDLIEQAQRFMASVADPRLHDTARLHYAHLDLALARRAQAQGDDALAARLRASVRALLAREPTDPDSGRSDARLARLVLERALAAAAIEAPPAGPEPAMTDEHALLIARDATAFRPPHGAWVDLSRRKPLRRILAALMSAGEVTTEELLRIAWPGERVSAQAGAARVHVAISTLRRLGLGAALGRGATGYYLDRRNPMVTDVQAPMQAVASGSPP